MERLDLPIEKLSLAQKLDLMEAIWNDLAKDEAKLESPDWHGRILKDREAAMESGKSDVSLKWLNEQGAMELIAVVVMPDHIHFTARLQNKTLPHIMHSLKKFYVTKDKWLTG